jgi:hypothetical protein
MKAPRFTAQALAACALAAVVAACGSNTTTTTKPPSSPSAPASSSAPTSPTANSAVTTTITHNWETFFNGKTPVDTRIALLENGSQFPKSALEPTKLSEGATAKVTKVTDITASTASVTYTVLLAGTPVLPNQKGTAVYQNGTWKVGVSSFCGLLSAENSGNTSKLPPVCKTG